MDMESGYAVEQQHSTRLMATADACEATGDAREAPAGLPRPLTVPPSGLAYALSGLPPAKPEGRCRNA
jgi:hypothetical protein